jgi:GcrA cell cycle regulator
MDIMPMCFIAGSTSGVAEPPTATRAAVATIERAPLQVGKAPCCWPLGDPGTASFRFCSALVVLNKPYCEEHYKAAYRKPAPSRERCAA